MATNASSSSDKKSRFWDFFNDPDEVKTPQNVEPNNKTSHEAGMERLRRMYSLDEYGRQSKEILFITQTVSMSCMGAAIIGSLIQSRETFLNFIENNQATKFANHIDAKRILQRQMFLAVGKGAFHWGWRVGVFVTTYTTLMTTVSIYRGHESVMEYIVAGGVAGGLYKINLGLKGVIAGSFLGSVLGVVAGSLSMLVLKVGGTSMNDMRDFSKMVVEYRDSAYQERRQKQLMKEYTDLSQRPVRDGTGLDGLKLATEPASEIK